MLISVANNASTCATPKSLTLLFNVDQYEYFQLMTFKSICNTPCENPMTIASMTKMGVFFKAPCNVPPLTVDNLDTSHLKIPIFEILSCQENSSEHARD